MWKQTKKQQKNGQIKFIFRAVILWELEGWAWLVQSGQEPGGRDEAGPRGPEQAAPQADRQTQFNSENTETTLLACYCLSIRREGLTIKDKMQLVELRCFALSPADVETEMEMWCLRIGLEGNPSRCRLTTQILISYNLFLSAETKTSCCVGWKWSYWGQKVRDH